MPYLQNDVIIIDKLCFDIKLDIKLVRLCQFHMVMPYDQKNGIFLKILFFDDKNIRCY